MATYRCAVVETRRGIEVVVPEMVLPAIKGISGAGKYAGRPHFFLRGDDCLGVDGLVETIRGEIERIRRVVNFEPTVGQLQGYFSLRLAYQVTALIVPEDEELVAEHPRGRYDAFEDEFVED